MLSLRLESPRLRLLAFHFAWRVLCGITFAAPALANTSGGKLHTAPVVITGKSISPIIRFRLESYRLFRSNYDGSAEVIPFQIDEINEWGDYVLDQGSQVTSKTGNGIFDLQDELSFMGDDVGPAIAPKTWPTRRPDLVFEIRLTHPLGNPGGSLQSGAVYVGIFFNQAPPLSDRKYVIFDRSTAEVTTSRYRYGFDQKNWLVSRRVEVKNDTLSPPAYEPVLDSTTFYLKADLKYFVTVEVNHRSIESSLEAYKSGPIRSIVRISYHYSLLKLKLELGMYTEISFFSNAVYLPAVMYNPLNGSTSLNNGSTMYYGLRLKENPLAYQIESNMPSFKAPSFFSLWRGQEAGAQKMFWLTAQGKGRMIYLEISPSPDLRKAGVEPSFYREDLDTAALASRDNDQVLALSKSPVNLAVSFDLTKFKEGEHTMSFRLFFENIVDEKRLQVFKSLGLWQYRTSRL